MEIMDLQLKPIYNTEKLQDLYDKSTLSSYSVLNVNGEEEDVLYVLDANLSLAHHDRDEKISIADNAGNMIAIALKDNYPEYDVVSETNTAMSSFARILRLSMDHTIMEVVSKGSTPLRKKRLFGVPK